MNLSHLLNKNFREGNSIKADTSPAWKEVSLACLALLTILLLPSLSFARDAVIHHTASKDVSASTINEWHKKRTYIDKHGVKRNWDGIGYHFVIRKDGSIEKGRSLDKQGAHAKGRNQMIGIVLTGEDNFTSQQVASLKKLIKELNITHIEPHHDKCPGHGLNLWEIARESNVSFTMWEFVKYQS